MYLVLLLHYGVNVICGLYTCVLLFFMSSVQLYMYVIKLNDISQFHFQVSSERYLIGLHDRKVEGNFHWMDGSQFDTNSFDSWGPNQPNNFAPNHLITNADCGSIVVG